MFVSQVRSALSGLKELDLSDLRYLSDLTFSRLTGCTPHLRRLSLAGCHIAFEFDPYHGCPVGAVKDSSALLSLRNLKRMLTGQRSTLVVLDISRTSITPESLRTVAQVSELCKLFGSQPQLLAQSSYDKRSHQLRLLFKVQGLVLEELYLQGCKELTDYSVEILVKHQPGLLKLDISGCAELTSRSVEAVARGLKSLTQLSLSRDWRITENGLSTDQSR